MARTMRKVRVGDVVRTNQDKTAIVEMIWKQRHRLYRKQMRRVARFYVHDPENQCRLGDTVRMLIQALRLASRKLPIPTKTVVRDRLAAAVASGLV